MMIIVIIYIYICDGITGVVAGASVAPSPGRTRPGAARRLRVVLSSLRKVRRGWAYLSRWSFSKTARA